MPTYTIRPATEADTEALVTIALAEWQAIYDGFADQLGEEIFPLIYPDPRADKAGQIRRNVASGTCFVTECDGRIAGFIHYTYDASTHVGTIGNNAVSGEFRGRGIGPRQYAHVFEVLKEQGAVAVRVTTGLDEGHAPARRAYEKAGFSANTQAITYFKKL